MNDILIVDDNTPLRMTLTETLSRAGLAVRGVKNGREAIASYKAKPAALVILDVFCRTWTGMETFRGLRALDSKVKVIGMSGLRRSLSEPCLGKLEAEGAIATLEKPFTAETLLQSVRTALGIVGETPPRQSATASLPRPTARMCQWIGTRYLPASPATADDDRAWIDLKRKNKRATRRRQIRPPLTNFLQDTN